MATRTRSITPKYEMTKNDIARIASREREVMSIEAVVRALIEKGVEPQLPLKEFAKRFRNGDLQSAQTDADRGLLPLAKSRKGYNRKVDMVAYLIPATMSCFEHSADKN